MSKFNGTRVRRTFPIRQVEDNFGTLNVARNNRGGTRDYVGPVKRTNATSIEGMPGYSMDAALELTSIAMNTKFDKNKTYRTETQTIQDMKNLSAKVGAEFLAKLAVYIREKADLRTSAHILSVLLAENYRGNKFTRKAVNRILRRPDDMTEIFAIWKHRHAKAMLPNAIRRAMKYALDEVRWDEYQLKKYSNEGKAVKLRDIIKLVHPAGNRNLYGRVISGNLKAADTMMTRRAAGQNTAEAAASMVANGTLGVSAALRNIVKTFEQNADTATKVAILQAVSDAKRLRKAKVLPFEIYEAWKAVERSISISSMEKAEIKNALNKALAASAANLDFVADEDLVVIAVDESSSMTTDGFEKAWLMAMVLATRGKGRTEVIRFATNSRLVTSSLINTNILDAMSNLKYSGGGTNFTSILDTMVSNNISANKLIIITDNAANESHAYGGGWRYAARGETYDARGTPFAVGVNNYRSRLGRPFQVMMWDIVGYGKATPIAVSPYSRDVSLLSGFSTEIIRSLGKLWKDPYAIIKEINAIEL